MYVQRSLTTNCSLYTPRLREQNALNSLIKIIATIYTYIVSILGSSVHHIFRCLTGKQRRYAEK